MDIIAIFLDTTVACSKMESMISGILINLYTISDHTFDNGVGDCK